MFVTWTRALSLPFIELFGFVFVPPLFYKFSFWKMVDLWSTWKKAEFLILSPHPLSAKFWSSINSSEFTSTIYFWGVAFVVGRLVMVWRSLVIELARFSMDSSASGSFRFPSSSEFMAIFAWYPADFAVDWDSFRSWWTMVKSVLKFYYTFYAAVLLLQVLQ